MILRLTYMGLLLLALLPATAQEEKGWPWPDSAVRRRLGIQTISSWWVNPLAGPGTPASGEVMEYNRQGQVIRAVRYDGSGKPPQQSFIFYDERHRPVKMVHAAGATDSVITLLAYDDAARTCIERYTLQGYERRLRIRWYNEQGLLLREEDRDGGETTFARIYTYRNGRVHTEQWLQRYDTVPSTLLQYHYTKAGLLYWKETVRNTNGDIGFPKHYYDKVNRLVKTISVNPADTSIMEQVWQNGLPVKQTYNSRASPYVNETEVQYNGKGLPEQIYNRQLIPRQDSLFFEYRYNGAGLLIQKTFYNNQGPAYSDMYEYDDRGRLIRETRSCSADTLHRQTSFYTYNSQGQPETTGIIRRAITDMAWGKRPRFSSGSAWDTVITKFEYKNGNRNLEYSIRNSEDADCLLEYGRRRYPNVVLEEADAGAPRRRQQPCGYMLKITDTISRVRHNGGEQIQLRVGVCAEISYNDSLPKTYRWRTLWLQGGRLQKLEDRDSAGLLLARVEPRSGGYGVTELAAVWRQENDREIKTSIAGPLISFDTDTIDYEAGGRVRRHVQYYGLPGAAGHRQMLADSVFMYKDGLLHSLELGNGQGYRQYNRYEYDGRGRLLLEKRYAMGGELSHQQLYEYRNGRLYRVYTGMPVKTMEQRIEYNFFEEGR